MDEDEMYQDAAASILGGQTNAEEGAAGGEENKGGMPDASVTTTVTDETKPPAADNSATTTTTTTDNAAAAAAAATASSTAPIPVNYEGISNGLIKSVDDITRIANEHKSMQAELTDLREKIKADPFANEFVKTLNQMQRDGKSPDQVKAFMKLQDLGEISKLSPIDAMIEARVLRDGRPADITRKMLERKYGITEDMDELEKQIAEETMRDDAKADYEYLTSQKKELATPKAEIPAAATQTITREQIISQVAPIKDKIKEQYNSFGELNLTAKFDKDGKPAADAILFDLPIPNEFKEKIPALVEDFFVTSNLPVTKENIEGVKDVINYELFKQYGVKIIQDACVKVQNDTEKRVRDEYEHKGGFKKQTFVNNTTANNLEDEFLKQYVEGV